MKKYQHYSELESLEISTTVNTQYSLRKEQIFISKYIQIYIFQIADFHFTKYRLIIAK